MATASRTLQQVAIPILAIPEDSTTLISMILITLALIFYSIGVWSERFAGRIKSWHLIFFWGGLIFDMIGTTIMMKMSGEHTADIHGPTSIPAILRMAIHAVWVSDVLVRKHENTFTAFHCFSVAVWVIWLIPYFSGFALASRQAYEEGIASVWSRPGKPR